MVALLIHNEVVDNIFGAEPSANVKRANPSMSTSDTITKNKRSTTSLVGYLAVSMTAAGVSVLSISFPNLISELGADAVIRNVLLAHSTAFVPALILGGFLSQRFRFQQVVAAGMLMTALGAILSAVTTETILLLVFRVIQSIGLGIVVPASLAMIVDGLPPGEKRFTAVARWAGTQAVAAVAGTLFAALVTSQFGWRGAYTTFGGLCFAVWIWCQKYNRNKDRERSKQKVKIPFHRLTAFGLAVATMTISISQLAVNYRVGTLFLAIVGIVMIILCVYVDKKANIAPILPRKALATSAFKWGNVGMIVCGAPFLGNFFLGAYVITNRWELPLWIVALLTAPTGIAMGMVSGWQARLGNEHGYWQTIGANAFLGVLCLITMALLVSFDKFNAVLWVLVMFLYGVSVAGSMPLFNAIAMDSVCPEESSSAASNLQVSRQLGGGIGVAIVAGSIAAGDTEGFIFAYITLALITLISIIIAIAASITPANRSETNKGT